MNYTSDCGTVCSDIPVFIVIQVLRKLTVKQDAAQNNVNNVQNTRCNEDTSLMGCEWLDCVTINIKALRFLDSSGSSRLTTNRNIPEDLNLQRHRCKNLISPTQCNYCTLN